MMVYSDLTNNIVTTDDIEDQVPVELIELYVQ
jgi:hypothetical protein